MATPRHPDRFIDRHIGPTAKDVVQMLEALGKGSLDALIDASVLDEGTAAAEAMSLVHAVTGKGGGAFFVASDCHPQTIEVVRTRARPLGWQIVVGDPDQFDFKTKIFGALLQYPSTDGRIRDLRPFISRVHAQGALAVVAADILSLCLLAPPGELGADIAVGSTQRFGVPLGYGGPHAAYFSCREEYVRNMPGRIIGVSVDAQGKRALRMALQTREQHIRREKATSNICTAQALLAIIASMYAVYHGPRGLKAIAQHVHGLTTLLAAGLRKMGIALRHQHFFDTLAVEANADQIVQAAAARRMNLRRIDARTVGISLDETCSREDVENILSVFGRQIGRASCRERVESDVGG